jgi:hypothetical protein
MYTTANGQTLLGVAGLGILVGSYVMNKMATLKA